MHTGAGLAGPGIAGLDSGRLRPLALALLASLALHVLVLYALPALKESIRAPAVPLMARLAKPQPPERPATTEPAPKARPAPPAPAARAAAPRTAALPPLSEAKPVAPVQGRELAKPPADPAPADPVASPAPQAPVARADPAPAPASVQASAGPDPGSVARFRLELMEIARRYKRYPRVAQDNNWEGRVELRIAFAENGSIASLTVKKGTGRAVLDDAAQAMIRSARAQAAIPPALRGRAFALDIAVDFFLRDEK